MKNGTLKEIAYEIKRDFFQWWFLFHAIVEWECIGILNGTRVLCANSGYSCGRGGLSVYVQLICSFVMSLVKYLWIIFECSLVLVLCGLF